MDIISTIIVVGTLLCLHLIFSDKKPYKSIVKEWSRPFNLKIIYYNRYSDIFECDTEEGTIYISRFNRSVHNKREYIYSIAHEIGHLIGALMDEEFDDGDTPKISDRETKKAIILDEERAWDIGRLLLKDAKLYEYHSFKKLREDCLKTYRDAKFKECKDFSKRNNK